jgi:hypothetical protein
MKQAYKSTPRAKALQAYSSFKKSTRDRNMARRALRDEQREDGRGQAVRGNERATPMMSGPQSWGHG